MENAGGAALTRFVTTPCERRHFTLRGVVRGSHTFKQLAEKHGKAPVQVILRWHIQAGHVVIPRSKNPARIKSNFDIFDFTLDDADMKAIAAMPQTGRLGPDPETFGNP